MASEIARALRSSSLANWGRLFLHTSSASFSPRKRPGTRNPLPDEEIQKRVEAIVYRYRKRPKCKDCVDYDFGKIGNYRIKDGKIQNMYKEYLRLYHPELAGDETQSSKGDNGQSKEGSSDKASGTN